MSAHEANKAKLEAYATAMGKQVDPSFDGALIFIQSAGACATAMHVAGADEAQAANLVNTLRGAQAAIADMLVRFGLDPALGDKATVSNARMAGGPEKAS